MKGLRRGILAFLLGELLTIWRKDPKLQKAVVKEKNVGNKLKMMGQALLDFNKGLIEDAKQIDLQAQRMQAKSWLTTETQALQVKIEQREMQAKEMTPEQLRAYVGELEQRIGAVVDKSKARVTQLEQTPEIGQHITTLKTHIAKIKAGLKN